MIGHTSLISDSFATLEHLNNLNIPLLPHRPRQKSIHHPASPKKRRATPPDNETLQMISEIVREETKSPPQIIRTSYITNTNNVVSESISSTPGTSQEKENNTTNTTSSTSSNNSTTSSTSSNSDTLWIFGYGSLIWKCDYPILRFVWGSVEGYKRRLWQGSPDHRGTPSNPGRVFTMLPAATVDQLEQEANIVQHNKDDTIVWGRCFELERKSAIQVMKEIDVREIAGFSKELIQVNCVDGIQREATVYAALADNEHFLGPATIDAIATHCYTSTGPSGQNSEYVLNTSKALINAADAFGSPTVDVHLKAVSIRLSGLQTGHTIQIETKEEFDKLNSGIGLCCKGRPVVIVDTQRVVSMNGNNHEDKDNDEDENSGNKEVVLKHSLTTEWPIIYYKFIGAEEGHAKDVVYHCNVYDDKELLPFTKIVPVPILPEE